LKTPQQNNAFGIGGHDVVANRVTGAPKQIVRAHAQSIRKPG
jgi:hypothetical protein